MGSVCGSTMSLLDAGVPLKAPVAGIAMGLVFAEGKYTTLTDIIGSEDHFGDMATLRELIEKAHVVPFGGNIQGVLAANDQDLTIGQQGGRVVLARPTDRPRARGRSGRR